MKIKLSLSHLLVVGLLATAPAVASAQQPTAPEAAARDQRTYTGGRHHENAAAVTAPTSGKSISSKGVSSTMAVAPPGEAGKSISEKGLKKTDAPSAALAGAPTSEAGRSISEKGVKRTDAALAVAPPAEAGKSIREKGVK
jgi:hypothetical protein